MKDYFSPEAQPLPARHGLDSFEALWTVPAVAVDEANHKDAGISQVYRLDLERSGFYLKRQRNYFVRNLHHPFGESSCHHELQAIQRYHLAGIPALKAAYFAERHMAREHRAILLTFALDSWQGLDGLLHQWPRLPQRSRRDILQACALLAQRLHQGGWLHGCLYPKHIFLQERDGAWRGCLIDLEKSRRLLLGRHDRVKDLETFLRRATPPWDSEERRLFLATYLGTALDSPEIDHWRRYIQQRHAHKAGNT